MVTQRQKTRALLVLDTLCAQFPDAKIELDYAAGDAWQLLVSVVLSAQATDVSVNKVTPALFARFPNVQAFARATAADVEPLIRTIGLFRNKAKNLVAAAQRVCVDFSGEVPSDRAQLQTLPGVGAKSAAVIVANCFGQPAIAVDTHVGRVAFRIGLTKNTNPDKVEADLTAQLPRARLLEAHHTFIWHGRRICHARNPACDACALATTCKKVAVRPPAVGKRVRTTTLA